MNDQPRTGEETGTGTDSAEESGISKRSVEIVVALLLVAFGTTVVVDSHRLGSAWGSDGPQSGYFPYYIGLLICFSGLATIAQVMFAQWRDRKTRFRGAVARHRALFVAWGPLRQVLMVLIPALVYVVAVQLIGIYVASAAYIAGFMVVLGKYSWKRSIAVGLLVNVGLFLMFEVWFKVPLFKGAFDPLFWTGY
jgi:putative tricarboxylic transport membrane protein